MEFTIEDGRDRIREAAAVAGTAFIHDASQHTQRIWHSVDDAERVSRYSRVFALTLALPGRNLLAAVSSGGTIGCLCYCHSRDVRLSLFRRLKLLVPFVRASGKSFRQLLKLQALIEELTPGEDMLHLGPVAVLPEYQGAGVGSRLLETFVARADRDGMSAFLQTGKSENVTLYERFGFCVSRQTTFDGAPVWGMIRECSPAEDT